MNTDASNKASLKRLQFCNFKLDCLLNITKAINDNVSTDSLLKRFERILREDLNIGKVLIYTYNEKWECALSSGFHRNIARNIHVDNDLMYYTQITSLTTTLNPYLGTFDVIIPVFHHEQPISYVIIGDIDEERAGISPTIKHLHFIQTLTNIIVVAIENRRLFKDSVRQESIKKELELASKMQSMLIPNPSSLPDNPQIKVAAYYLPHSEVGGDYYDFMSLGKDEYGFCIADVSGKGISAALLMSNFQANIRALFTSRTSLEKIVEKLNERVIKNTNGEKFITLFIGRYNTETREIEYINAGHNPPVLVDRNTNECQYLTTGCTGIGMFDEIPNIHIGKQIAAVGMRLVCYTDGIVEMENENQIEFGTKLLESCLKSEARIDLAIDKIIDKLEQHKGQKKFFDDISILGMEFF